MVRKRKLDTWNVSMWSSGVHSIALGHMLHNYHTTPLFIDDPDDKVDGGFWDNEDHFERDVYVTMKAKKTNLPSDVTYIYRVDKVTCNTLLKVIRDGEKAYKAGQKPPVSLGRWIIDNFFNTGIPFDKVQFTS